MTKMKYNMSTQVKSASRISAIARARKQSGQNKYEGKMSMSHSQLPNHISPRSNTAGETMTVHRSDDPYDNLGVSRQQTEETKKAGVTNVKIISKIQSQLDFNRASKPKKLRIGSGLHKSPYYGKTHIVDQPRAMSTRTSGNSPNKRDEFKVDMQKKQFPSVLALNDKFISKNAIELPLPKAATGLSPPKTSAKTSGGLSANLLRRPGGASVDGETNRSPGNQNPYKDGIVMLIKEKISPITDLKMKSLQRISRQQTHNSIKSTSYREVVNTMKEQINSINQDMS